MLAGTRFPDAIGNGTYPVDIHSDGDDGISFRKLNGDMVVFSGGGRPPRHERWLPKNEILPFYQFTLGSLIPAGTRNLITAGRMLDADAEAFGAVRVMVNLNQCGEAAGVAAWQAVQSGGGISRIDSAETRRLLQAGGSIIM